MPSESNKTGKVTRLRKLMSWLNEQVLERSRSAMHPELTVELAYGRLVLNGRNVNHAWGPLHDVFVEAFALTRPDLASMHQVAVVGFGAGDVAMQLRTLGFQGTIFGIEPDPEVVRLFRTYFYHSTLEPLVLLNEESSIRHLPPNLDLVITDAFIEDQVPATCRNLAFYQDIASRIVPGGIYIQNFMTGTPERMQEFSEAQAAAATCFHSVRTWKIDHNHILHGHA